MSRSEATQSQVTKCEKENRGTDSRSLLMECSNLCCSGVMVTSDVKLKNLYRYCRVLSLSFLFLRRYLKQNGFC